MKTGGHGREAKRAKILQALKAGNTRRASYQYAGVDHETFRQWMLQESQFLAQVEEAEATAEITCATSILNAARKGDWRAADKWLSKRRKEEWGDELNLRLLSDEELLQRAKGLLAGDGPAGPELPRGTGGPDSLPE